MGAESTKQMDATRQQLLLLEQRRNDCLGVNTTEPDSLFCPRVFDGIACWEATPAGVTVTKPCPHYLKGFYSHNTMQKSCMEDGTWFVLQELNKTWTNFTSCHLPPPSVGALLHYSDNELIQYWTPVIKLISIVGYGISLTALIVAMVIFCSIRKLRSCPRTNLHTHLFVSFIFKAGLWFAKESVARDWVSPEHSGGWLCKLVTGTWQYFTMANYSWVTMEGLYLFCLIYLALFSDHSSITAYIVMGWGFPVCFVVPWVIVRALKEDYYCWLININAAYFWIIRGPIIFLILANAFLFVCIVLVLMQKLNSSISVETRRYRKLARSTLVLIPLFGFHYVVFVGFSAFMNVNRVLELIWLFGDQLFASFQGFFVAILYCFVSSEVKMELKKHWAAWRYSNVGVSNNSGRHRNNHAKGYSVGRSSVQSTTLMEKTSDLGQGRTTSPLVKAVKEKTSPRQGRVETITEDALEDSKDVSADTALVDPASDCTPADLLVRYNGVSGGSVSIETTPRASDRDALVRPD